MFNFPINLGYDIKLINKKLVEKFSLIAIYKIIFYSYY